MTVTSAIGIVIRQGEKLTEAIKKDKGSKV